MGVRVTMEKVRRILPETFSFCPDDMEGSFSGTDPFSNGHGRMKKYGKADPARRVRTGPDLSASAKKMPPEGVF